MTKRELIAAGSAVAVVVVALLAVVFFPDGKHSPAVFEGAEGSGSGLKEQALLQGADEVNPSAPVSSVESVISARTGVVSPSLTLEVLVTGLAGTPLAGAHVFPLDSGLGITGKTDSTGRVLLENLPESTGRLSIFLVGYDRVTFDFDLAKSESITVRLGREYGLEVLVVDPVGKPASGVRLRLVLADTLSTPPEKRVPLGGIRFLTTHSDFASRGVRPTDQDGRVRFRGSSSWEGRTLRLEVYGPTPCEGPIEIPWDAGRYTLRLSRSPWSIVGKVRDADGEPLVPKLSWEGPSITEPPVVGSDGTFRATGLLLDEIVLSFEHFPFLPQRIVVPSPTELEAGYPVELDVILKRSRMVSLDVGKARPQDLKVWLVSDEGEVQAVSIAFTNPEGPTFTVCVPEEDTNLRVEVGGGSFKLFCPAGAERLQISLPIPGRLTVSAPSNWRAGSTIQVRREDRSGSVMREQLYHRESGLVAYFSFVLPGIYLVTHEDKELEPLRVDIRAGAQAEASFEAWMRSEAR